MVGLGMTHCPVCSTIEYKTGVRPPCEHGVNRMTLPTDPNASVTINAPTGEVIVLHAGDAILLEPIDTLELSVRPYNCLKREGIDTVGKLCGCTKFDLLNMRALGQTSLWEIRSALRKHGLHIKEEGLADEYGCWPHLRLPSNAV